MKQAIWETETYYQTAKSASQDLSHPGLQYIKQVTVRAKHVLEVGCGEGSKLNGLVPKAVTATGVDISEKAISLAKKQYPHHTFITADATQLPFENQRFDVVFSAFMLEHVTQPEKVIEEMIRVLKSRGHLVILTPNYGATPRRSPCYRANRLVRLVVGSIRDFWYYFGFGWMYWKLETQLFRIHRGELDWNMVEPIATQDHYQIDWDTTTEPNLITLIHFLSSRGMVIQHQSSCWEIAEPSMRWGMQMVRFLGRWELYPFKYWGPHLFVVATKRDTKEGKTAQRLRTLLHWIKALFILILIIMPFTPLLLAGWLGLERLVSYSLKKITQKWG